MRHVHPLRFEALEQRKPLSGAHAAVAHPARAVASIPLVLDGTLTVNHRAATTTMNMNGSSTVAVPVSGQLGALGAVRGVWNESFDVLGDATGPDSLRLRDSKGSFVLTFNNQDPGPPHPLGRGTVFFEHPQRLYAGTGAYAKSSESGTIEIVSNAAKTVVESLVLNTPTT